MKRRTLIVDLDCPFGINHFDLMECDMCVDQEMILEKMKTGIVNPLSNVPPFAPVQTNQTIEWTTISAGSTTDMTWTNFSGGAVTSPVYRIDLSNTTADSNVTKTFDLAKISIT